MVSISGCKPDYADLLTLVCDVYCNFVTFPFGILGQVWYLTVSISDLCCLSYLKKYGFHFNCSTLGQASMTALTLSFHRLAGAWCLSLVGPIMAQLEVFFSSNFL